MAKSWYLMARLLFNSGYEKDEFENYSQDGFAEVLESFISSDIEVYNQNFTLLQSLKAIIQNVTADAESSRGGAYRTLEYAKRKKHIQFINIEN